MQEDLSQLGAARAAEEIRNSRISSVELVTACIQRIGAVDKDVEAWAYFDPAHALAQARAADAYRATGRPLGPLHGVPVGIKDIIDTRDMPTERGTVLHSGRQPVEDATVVALLREAGAVIMGKTVTTELAVFGPGKTKNPHDPARTPGGSSSGSAAAVAAGMVPLAVGTQTNGSVIRPASYCGVYGFKPSFGRISRYRVMEESKALDTVGVFGRSVEDCALISDVLMAYDSRDGDMIPRARPALRATAMDEPPVTPHVAFVKTPVWSEADEDTKEAFAELVREVGGSMEVVDLSEGFKEAWDWHRTIMETDLAVSFADEYERGKDKLTPVLREMIERGGKYLAADYVRARGKIDALNEAFSELFETYDAFLTPATTGEAPLGLESTGSPVFCTLWTLCGMPAVNLPLMLGGNGMPLGAQLVGPKGDDARLLRTARWLARQVEE